MKPKVSLKTYKLSDLRVDPENMDMAMRAVVDGVTSRTPDAPLNVTEYDGGVYLVDGHHRVAALVLAEEDFDALFEKTIKTLSTKIRSFAQWPFGNSEEMAPENWISFAEWITER